MYIFKQIDFYPLLKHEDSKGGKELRCPYCICGKLKGDGFNDGLRTGFGTDGAVFKAFYSRFECTNGACSGNPNDRRRGKGR